MTSPSKRRPKKRVEPLDWRELAAAPALRGLAEVLSTSGEVARERALKRAQIDAEGLAAPTAIGLVSEGTESVSGVVANISETDGATAREFPAPESILSVLPIRSGPGTVGRTPTVVGTPTKAPDTTSEQREGDKIEGVSPTVGGEAFASTTAAGPAAAITSWNTPTVGVTTSAGVSMSAVVTPTEGIPANEVSGRGDYPNRLASTEAEIRMGVAAPSDGRSTSDGGSASEGETPAAGTTTADGASLSDFNEHLGNTKQLGTGQAVSSGVPHTEGVSTTEVIAPAVQRLSREILTVGETPGHSA